MKNEPYAQNRDITCRNEHEPVRWRARLTVHWDEEFKHTVVDKVEEEDLNCWFCETPHPELVKLI